MIAFRVLIVDDDMDDREFLRDALEQAGIEPILALESAQQVFTYLQSVQCDEDLPKIIITDLNMCGITGLELLGALKGMQRYQHISVVVFSTANAVLAKQKCLAAGAKHYITKPSSISGYRDVSAKVKDYLLD
jgi:CheY-like chemotaxis protein